MDQVNGQLVIGLSAWLFVCSSLGDFGVNDACKYRSIQDTVVTLGIHSR